MKTKTLLISLLTFLFTISTASAARKVITVERITSSLTLSEAVDYHITASGGCIAPGVTVNLAHQDAWLFFDNVRPIELQSKWLSYVKVNDQPIIAQKTAWINIYKHGAVILPYAENFAPLTVFTGELYSGESQSFSPGRYQALGTFDNKIKSFKLKRGYMVTLAQGKDGSGYSRCFIAQDDDIEIPNLLDPASCKFGGALYNKTSFIRVMRWQMPSKKGAVDSDPDLTECTWYYNYNASNASKHENLEYVNMWATLYWNTDAQFGNVSDTCGVTHTLGFNEPWHGEDGGFMHGDPKAPIPYHEKLLKNGLRLGSMAPDDANLEKLFAFIQECDRKGLRVDFVAIHTYQYHDANWWYNFTKTIYEKTKRPVWITEFNNGANWTTEDWPGITWEEDEKGNRVRKIVDLEKAQQKQAELLTAVCKKLDEAPWVERYSVFSHVEEWRGIVDEVSGTSLTTSGIAYKNLRPGIAYNPAYEYIPTYPQFEKPTFDVNTSLLMTQGQVSITISEKSGEYLDRYVLEKKIGNGKYQTVKEGTEANMVSYIDRWDMENPHPTTYRASFYYCNETTPRYAEEKNVDINIAETAPIRYGTASLPKADWSYVMYEPFEIGAGNLPIFGGAPAASISNQPNQFTYSLYPTIAKNNFRAKIIPWGFMYNYNENGMSNLDYSTLAPFPYMIVDTLTTHLENQPVEAGIISKVNGEWMQVSFKKPFEEIPVVFTTLLTNRHLGENKAPVYPRIRNVTPTGFELHLTRESKLESSSWPSRGEEIGYYAITPGQIKIVDETNRDTLHIVVNRTDESISSLIASPTVQFPVKCPDYSSPVLVSALQSSNDEYTSTLTYSKLNHENVKLYKTDEKSTSTTNNLRFKKDAVGYILFYRSQSPSGIGDITQDSQNQLKVYEQNGILRIDGVQGNKVTLYTIGGVPILTTPIDREISLENIPSGHYILRSDKNETAKFTKE